MKDIAARELKGHNILAVERFWDSTCWMIEFTVLRPTAYGEPSDEMRLFLTEDGYQSALQSQQRREIKIKRYPKRINAAVHQVIVSHIEEHSKKPQEARERIVSLMGDLPRIELFARQSTPGWDVWGNEVDSSISFP